MGLGNRKTNKIGVFIGYFIAFFIATILIYYILNILKTFPKSWGFLHILFLMSAITFIAILARRILK